MCPKVSNKRVDIRKGACAEKTYFWTQKKVPKQLPTLQQLLLAEFGVLFGPNFPKIVKIVVFSGFRVLNLNFTDFFSCRQSFFEGLICSKQRDRCALSFEFSRSTRFALQRTILSPLLVLLFFPCFSRYDNLNIIKLCNLGINIIH